MNTIQIENAQYTKNWTGPVQCFPAEMDHWFQFGPRLRPAGEVNS